MQSEYDQQAIAMILVDPEKAESQFRLEVPVTPAEMGRRSAIEREKTVEKFSVVDPKPFKDSSEKPKLIGPIRDQNLPRSRLFTKILVGEGYVSRYDLASWLDMVLVDKRKLEDERKQICDLIEASRHEITLLDGSIFELKEDKDSTAFIFLRFVMTSGWPYVLVLLLGLKIARKSVFAIWQDKAEAASMDPKPARNAKAT